MATPPEARAQAFEVHLDVFTGPFDLLLTLISRRQLDVTEVALAEVTDEFVSYIRSREDWDLSVASDFLLVGATLLDLKAARLLPTGEQEDPENLALLEARALLFARLLQYRAFKQVAALFSERMAALSSFHPRMAPLETHFAAVLPELVWSLGPAQLASIASHVLSRIGQAPPEVDVSHLAVSRVSVGEQAAVLSERLRRASAATFRALVGDVRGEVAIVIARFLALLELYKAGAVAFEQVMSFGELTVRWTGLGREVEVADEYERIGE